ncbi:MAG: helix-turn-helix domain-containing protein [Spirochaetales bacterium]|nr:helix-turn-helix domain-containing protein [Spirochaetales bacterium]
MRMLRSELGFTQSELADALHVSFTTINRWENGKSVPSHRSKIK